MNQIQTVEKIRHFPVLLKEFLNFFKDKQLSIFLDGTLGLAGHATALLEEHPEIDIFIGLDQDKEALNIANDNLKKWMSKVRLFHENYVNMDKILDGLDIKYLDGIFLDLGVSSLQLDKPERGFSFRFDAPLDMRMDKEAKLTAQHIVNRYSEKELERIFTEYGEERKARKAAQRIVIQRKKKPIKTTFELLEVLEPVLGKRHKIHPATKIFQALRICVNNELEVLKIGLENAIKRLSKNGIIAVISFHSLEDRIVKHTFKDSNYLEVLTKKPIVAQRDERNPRARSAKMRFAKRI